MVGNVVFTHEVRSGSNTERQANKPFHQVANEKVIVNLTQFSRSKE